MNRKELQRQYRETRHPMGLFRVRNTRTGRWFLGASVNVPAMLNRQRFQLDAGSHPNPHLQREWRELGAGAFAFQTLDLLAPPDEPGYDPAADLRTLEAMWREKLLQADGPGYAGEEPHAAGAAEPRASEPAPGREPGPAEHGKP